MPDLAHIIMFAICFGPAIATVFGGEESGDKAMGLAIVAIPVFIVLSIAVNLVS